MMMRHTFLTWGLATLLAGALQAQNPVPAPPQAKPMAIVGATAHLGNGQVIENALVTFAAGKITGVKPTTAADQLDGYEVIKAVGQHLYPGFIAPNSQLGLVEIEAVRATVDNREMGEMNPNVRSLIAYNTDSRVIPTIRARGVLLAQVAPDGGTLAGSSSVVQLDAWNWEDAALRPDDGQHLYWPNRFSYNWTTQQLSKNQNYDDEVAAMQQFVVEAKAYCQQPEPKTFNLKLAAMCALFSGERALYVHANLARDIEQAVLLAREHGFRLVIVGGRDSYQLTQLLRDQQVAVVLQPAHNLPATADSDVDQPFKTAAQLHQAGVLFCLSADGFWQQRNLPFQAGTAVAYGLPYEEAIRALSLNTATILGVDNRVGSIEVGKDATFFLCAGDVLDMRSSDVTRAFIEGRDIDLNNVQKALYERFQEKYRRQ